VRSVDKAFEISDMLQRILNSILTLAILGCLLLYAIEFLSAGLLDEAWPLERFARFGAPFVAGIARWLPGPAKPFAPLVLAAIIYFVIVISNRLFALGRHAAATAKPAHAAKAKTPAATTVESEKARAQLYKEYHQIESALKAAKRRRCTFLSVDVAGSTAIKVGEAEIAVTATFRAYEDLLRRTFKATHAWKQSWTPDGAMVCFLNLTDAVTAAQTILRELPDLNDRDNRLKARLSVRCGVNEGDVVIFDDSAIEKLVERTIDVAGHLQKNAAPGTLLVSADVYEALQDRSGFEPAAEEVDGYATYAWSPPAAQPHS
jgi:class 3 adenylate cyclase